MASPTPSITAGFLQHNRVYITSIEISEFIRLREIKTDIPIGTNIFAIAGENGAGKTSFLTFIESMISPQAVKSPGHNGALLPKGRITLSDREGNPVFYWDRWWKDGKASVTLRYVDTGKVVESAGQVIKELTNSFGDPLRFINAKPIEQRQRLEKAAGIDLSENDALTKQAEEEAKRLENRQQALLARSEALPWYTDVPDEELDITQLTADIQEVLRTNSNNEIIKNSLVLEKQQVDQAAAELARHQERIEQLKRDIEAAQFAQETAQAKLEAATERAKRKESEVALLEYVDVAPYEEKIATMQEINSKVRENQLKLTAVEEWTQAEGKVKEQVNVVNALKLERKRILASAKFPIEGLDFEIGGGVLLNGNPFSQASNAEKLIAALLIEVSMSPLRVAYIDEAAALDNKSMRILAETAHEIGALVLTFFAANRGANGDYDRPADLYLYEGAVDEDGHFDPEFYLKNGDQIPQEAVK